MFGPAVEFIFGGRERIAVRIVEIITSDSFGAEEFAEARESGVGPVVLHGVFKE